MLLQLPILLPILLLLRLFVVVVLLLQSSFAGVEGDSEGNDGECGGTNDRTGEGASNALRRRLGGVTGDSPAQVVVVVVVAVLVWLVSTSCIAVKVEVEVEVVDLMMLKHATKLTMNLREGNSIDDRYDVCTNFNSIRLKKKKDGRGQLKNNEFKRVLNRTSSLSSSISNVEEGMRRSCVPV